MDDLKINRVTFPNIEYVQIPKADGSGNAVFRNMNGFHEDSDLINLLNGSITELDDEIGDISGTLRSCAFREADRLQYVNLPNVITLGNYCFYGCNSLEEVQLDGCQTIDQYSFASCPELERVSLKSLCGSYNSYIFNNSPKLKVLILGQNQVSSASGYINEWFSTSNNKNYVPSDLVKLYKAQNLWSSHATRFRSMEQLDRDETDYVLYQIIPSIQQVSGNIYNRAMCKYQTSVETVYGRETYIVGRAQDTLTIEATCQGYVTKNMTISLDSSYTTTIEPDLRDMQVDANYNGYNLLYADFTKFEQNLGTYGYCNRNNTYAWSAFDTRHLGCGNFSNGRFDCGITLPTYSGMTNPTFVFEASVYFASDSITGTSGLYNMTRRSTTGGTIDIDKISIKHIRSNGGGISIEGLDLIGHHHIGLVTTSSTVYVYIDGVLHSTVQNSNLFNSLKTTTTYIGRDNENNYPFKGRIKQLALTLRDIADPSVASNCEFILPIPQS